MKASPLLISVVLSLTLTACGKDEPEKITASPETVTSPPVAVEQEQVTAATDASAALTDGLSGYDIYVIKCIGCHGDVGQGMGDNPKLAGLTRVDVGFRLMEYRDGKTRGAKTAVMAPAAKELTDGQIAALANYIGE